MPADEGRPGPRHRGGVEWDPHPERHTLAKRAARPVPDGVAVLPVPRRIAGVEPGRGCPQIANRDVPWKKRIERPFQVRRCKPAFVGECDHLAAGVHTGICPAGPVDALGDPAIEASERGLEDPLDRPFPRIDLEPGKVRPVIFDRRAIARRDALSSACCTAKPPLSRAQCKAPPRIRCERTEKCVSVGPEAATRQ